MKTFPKFKKLSEVPKYGLTVGLNTIFSLSKKAVLVLTGKEKQYAFKILIKNKKFNYNWPSSIIYKCKNANIYTEKKIKYNL